MGNQNQPTEFDAVLGGQAPPPVEGIVLGGLDGVKRRLSDPVVEVRVGALSEALNYGEAGLDLIIEALPDSSQQVQHFARLLRERGGLKGKQALLDFNPQLFFTTFANWKTENFNPEVGITDPVGTAYRLSVDWAKWKNSQAALPKSFELFLQDPQASQIEALLLPFGRRSSCELLVKALAESKERLTNLKALYIGDMHDYEYKTSDVYLSNMTPVLEAYPNLEVLQFRGFGDDDSGLSFHVLQHKYLKTLIVETGYMLGRQVIDGICALELPALEYLELWLGNDEFYPIRLYEEQYHYSIDDSALKNLMPIISGEVFPKLKYLGLRSSNYSDNIAKAIVNSPLMNCLKVLDLSMGTLTNEGAKALLNSLAINQLHTLNVSMNLLSASMTQQLAQLKCQVITEPQVESEEYRYYGVTE